METTSNPVVQQRGKSDLRRSAGGLASLAASRHHAWHNHQGGNSEGERGATACPPEKRQKRERRTQDD